MTQRLSRRHIPVVAFLLAGALVPACGGGGSNGGDGAAGQGGQGGGSDAGGGSAYHEDGRGSSGSGGDMAAVLMNAAQAIGGRNQSVALNKDGSLFEVGSYRSDGTGGPMAKFSDVFVMTATGALVP